jgi:hypothetical protein
MNAPAEEEREQQKEFGLEQGFDEKGSDPVCGVKGRQQYRIGRQAQKGHVYNTNSDQRRHSDCIDSGIAVRLVHGILPIERLLNVN